MYYMFAANLVLCLDIFVYTLLCISLLYKLLYMLILFTLQLTYLFYSYHYLPAYLYYFVLYLMFIFFVLYVFSTGCNQIYTKPFDLLSLQVQIYLFYLHFSLHNFVVLNFISSFFLPASYLMFRYIFLYILPGSFYSFYMYIYKVVVANVIKF